MPMKSLALALLLVAASAQPVQAGSAPAAAVQGTFVLAPLPYPADALAPVIDRETMELHHGKHHKGYVDKLNEAVGADATLKGLSVERLLARASSLPGAVRDNAGGHWNHSFFWPLMAAEGQRGSPSPGLVRAITRDFGGMQQFKAAFEKAGTGQFGSGWAWLVLTPEGRLAVGSTANQDNPLMDDSALKGIPVLGNDLWEHAYYLTWRNRRGDYLSNWWTLVNWNRVNALYAEALEQPGGLPR